MFISSELGGGYIKGLGNWKENHNSYNQAQKANMRTFLPSQIQISIFYPQPLHCTVFFLFEDQSLTSKRVQHGHDPKLF